jgi:hypothetical protein
VIVSLCQISFSVLFIVYLDFVLIFLLQRLGRLVIGFKPSLHNTLSKENNTSNKTINIDYLVTYILIK